MMFCKPQEVYQFTNLLTQQSIDFKWQLVAFAS